MAIDPAKVFENNAFALQDEMNEAMARGDSEIQSFYRGLTLFITGGSGFIGKQLIEKLFRSSDIKKVFMLIRPKKGMEIQARLKNVLSDPVFNQLRKKKPDFEDRIVPVAGDVAELGLGINHEDRSVLVQEVEVIFHGAATTRFDEVLHLAAIINIRGTREALTLARACGKLKSFVHVSTAYSNATSDRVSGKVLDRFYRSPVSPQLMIELAEKIESEKLHAITDNFINGWPNTYTFTKAIAEDLVRTESAGLPVAIVRPSIVICAYAEPIPGWLDPGCAYGPTGIVLGVLLGVIKVLLVDNERRISFVPVDYVNNAIIAAGWDVAIRAEQSTPIYTISCTNYGVTFKNISYTLNNEARNMVSNLAVWYCGCIETKSRLMFWILTIFLHFIPAYIVDTVVKVGRIKIPKEMKSFVKLYTKYDKQSKVFEYFLANDWLFDDTNLISLRQRLSEADKKIYNFDIKNIDWDIFPLFWALGTRKYIIKDGLKNTERAVRKQKWFKMAHYAVICTYICIGLWVVSLLVKILW